MKQTTHLHPPNNPHTAAPNSKVALQLSNAHDAYTYTHHPRLTRRRRSKPNFAIYRSAQKPPRCCRTPASAGGDKGLTSSSGQREGEWMQVRGRRNTGAVSVASEC